MDKNALIGISLIFLLFLVWQEFFAPPLPQEVQKTEQARLDSLAKAGDKTTATARPDTAADGAGAAAQPAVSDSVRVAQLAGRYGAFAPAAVGKEELVTLQNDLFKITFTNKGGRIRQVELLKHAKIVEEGPEKTQKKVPLLLLEDYKNRFDYLLPLAGQEDGIRSGELYFTPEVNGKTVTFRAPAGEGRYFEQKYTLEDGSYVVDYDLRFEGLQQVLANDAQRIRLNWTNYLDRIEINHNYERNYSTVYYKPSADNSSYCSCTASDSEDLKQTPIQWVSNANQFFNSSLIADKAFPGAVVSTEVLDPENEDLKKLSSQIDLPYGHSPSEAFGMKFYIGPNDFENLRAINADLVDIIPFGRSIFGAINRWTIRPIFNFLDTFIGSKGLAILFLTLLVKLLVYPLTYRMIHSQSKMAALKPHIEKLKEKHKDDQQTQQMETMKLYREFGVNPLGGCFPMLLQLPIWFALYRFFPASITFRQADFWWATDLSSYDVIARLPFNIPFFGEHLSLFAFLWAISTLIYTYYNTQSMDFSANPAMKWMQYIMPVMFLGFFNSFAAGLTCYLLFSNVLNIAQTIVTKNYIINHDKIKADLEAYRQNPKKKSGFQERLETAMRDQQRKQAELEQARKKGGKK